MKWRLPNEQDGVRTFVLVFEHGDTVMDPLLEFLEAESVGAARLSGIGALESITLGYFDSGTKNYEPHEVAEQVDLLSLAGDVALKDREPAVHAHVIGRRDTTTRGGHLIDATVRPTLELIVEDAPAHLQKRVDPETGLALIAP